MTKCGLVFDSPQLAVRVGERAHVEVCDGKVHHVHPLSAPAVTHRVVGEPAIEGTPSYHACSDQ